MLATASRSAWPAAPSAWFACPCSSARSRATASRCSGVISSSLSPSSWRSWRASLGSPPALACGLLVAARDSDRDERRDRRRALLVGGVELGPDLVLDRAELREVEVEVARVRAQPLRELPQLLRQARAWVVRVGALVREVLRDLVDALRLSVGLLADLAVRGDDGVLRVRQQDRRHEQRGGDERDQRGPPGEARPEQAGIDDREPSHGVAALAPDEARLGVAELEAVADGDRLLVVRGRPGPRSPGFDCANASADASASPDPPSASTASAVSPIDGRASRRARAGRASRRSGPRARPAAPTRAARSASRSRRRAGRPRRPRARTTRAEPRAAATAAADGGRARPAA